MLGGFGKVCLWLVLFLLVVFLIKAQPDMVSSTYQFSIPDYNEMPEMYREVVNEVRSDKIRYELDPNDIYINETGNYSEIVLEDFFYTHNFGMPMLPIKYFEIPIPSDAKSLKIEIVNPAYTEINVNKKIKPYMFEEDFLPIYPRYKIYDEYFSSPDFVTVDFGYRGEQKYALVRYHPFGYDSKNNKLNITTSAILEIGCSDEEYRSEKKLQAFGKALTTKEMLSDGQGPDVEWEKTFGGSGYDEGRSVQQTSDNGYIILGDTNSFGAGNIDVYLIKTDSSGNNQWQRTFGGSKSDYGNSGQKTSDGGYIIVGSTWSFGDSNGYNDVYLIKTDSNGGSQWVRTFGGNSADVGWSVQQTSDNGYIIAGYTKSFGAGIIDFYLIKTDSNGNNQWQRTFGGGDWDRGYSVQQTSDNGYIIAGYTRSFADSNGDVYLIKTDSNGNNLWNRTFGGSDEDEAYAVEQTSDNGYVVLGYTRSFSDSNGDVYLIKTDSNGREEWNKTFGGSDYDAGMSIQQTSDNGYIILGDTNSFGAGNTDFYLIKTDTIGNNLWSRTFGGSSYDYGNSVQQTSDEGYVISGITNSFGLGNGDVYLIKLKKEDNCNNGIKDEDETDIDCGGSCSPCSDGKSCLVDSDCQSNYCNSDNICETITFDLSVDSSDISFVEIGNEVNISAIIKNNAEYLTSNIEIKFLDTYNGNLIKETTIDIGSISSQNSKTASVNWNLEKNHIVYVIVDPNNIIKESDKSNNNAYKEYIGTLKYYVKADVPPSKASDEIESYIKNNIKEGVIIDDEKEADVKVLVARHNPLIVWHFETLEEEGWGYYGGVIKFQDEVCSKPYCGVVGDLIKAGKKEIYVEANDIDGFIAGAKAFIGEQDSFTTPGNVIFLGKDNEEAIAVYDYLHTPSNLPYYKEDSDEFREIVRKALNGGMFTEEQVNTTANGVTLRLLHLKPGFSDIFIEYKDKLKMPVVLARGLWSNLYTWKDFGEDLSNEGRDTWLIEITGGPGQDCNSCVNYDFDDLTDSYVPALLNKVLSETGKSELQYVGFSNGCRATLSSLEKGMFDPNKVETFVGVGCPGNFSELSYFAQLVDESGGDAIQSMRDKGIEHVTFSRVAHELNSLLGELASFIWFVAGENNTISLNLFDKYYYWINSEDDAQPGEALDIDYFTLIYGTDGFYGSEDDDGIISVNDEKAIFENIQSSNKILKEVKRRHSDMPEDKETQSYVKSSLNKNIY